MVQPLVHASRMPVAERRRILMQGRELLHINRDIMLKGYGNGEYRGPLLLDERPILAIGGDGPRPGIPFKKD